MKIIVSATTPAETADVVAVNPIPVGSVMAYTGTDTPNGWLLCNGQTISATSYPDLVSVLGSTTVPDLRSRFIVGTGQGNGLSNYKLNGTGGEETVTLTTDQIPSHQHEGLGESTGGWPFGNSDSKGHMGSKGGIDNDNYYYYTSKVGADKSHNNLPPYYVLTYIIKY